jgi:NAD(P)H-hydrate epimerase
VKYIAVIHVPNYYIIGGLTMYLASSEDIKKLDKLASEKYGIPESQLMENAGKSIFNEIKDNFSNNKFAVFCGKGNNGGDGFVVARLLKSDGRDVKVYLTHEETEFSDAAKIAYDKLKEEKIEILKITDNVDKDAVIIDALLGISVSGAPRGNIKSAIDKITSMNNAVISIDIPSGLSADNGKAMGSVVKADYTYTLALDKVGLNMNLGKSHCGIKKVLDIGVPKGALSELMCK